MTRDLAFSVLQLPNGTVQGQGLAIGRHTKVTIMFDVTSCMFVGGDLMMAGPLRTANAPGRFVVGHTFAFAVRAGSPPGGGVSSIEVLPPNLTIQQIAGLVGAVTMIRSFIAATLRPLIAGSIMIH